MTVLNLALALAISTSSGPFSTCSRTTSEQATPDLPVYSCKLSPGQAYRYTIELLLSSNKEFDRHGIGEHLGIPKFSTDDICSPTYCTHMVVLKAAAEQANWIVYIKDRDISSRQTSVWNRAT